MSKRTNHIIDISFQLETLKTSVKVALVVGIILNLINQGDLIIGMNFNEINMTKFLVTFLVPFGVSTYSTVKAKLEFRIGDTTAIHAEIECMNCELEKVTLQKEEQIPNCPKCQHRTNWQLVD